MTHDGHQIAVAARFRPENAEAVLRVVESDPLHKTGKHFLGR
jgi:acetolactate synthase regulatory subunit